MSQENHQKKSFFPLIQLYRGVAALIIIYGHSMIEIGRIAKASGGDFSYLRYPHAVGVDLFFVISGFVIVFASRTLFEKPKAWQIFIVKRIARILPLYWFYTTLIIAVALIIPSALDSAQWDIAHIVQSYLFIPHTAPSGDVRPILSLGWSLNYEMYFYAIFACLLCLPRAKAMQAMMGFFLLTCIIAPALPDNLTALKFWFHPHTLQFLIGAIIAHIHLNGTQITKSHARILTITGITALLALFAIPYIDLLREHWSTLRITGGFIAGTCLIASATLYGANATRSINTIWKKLGDSSYTLYLSHPFIIGVVSIIGKKILPATTAGYWTLASISFVSCLIGGYILYEVIERPLLRCSRKLTERYLAPRS